MLEVLLLVNGLWDFLSAWCISASVDHPHIYDSSQTKLIFQHNANWNCGNWGVCWSLGMSSFQNYIASFHTGWWRKAGYDNPSSRRVMVWLLLTFGLFRFGAAMRKDMLTSAIFTYILEIAWLCTEAWTGVFHADKAFMSVFLSVGCLIIIISNV